jgi:hypothetical protein
MSRRHHHQAITTVPRREVEADAPREQRLGHRRSSHLRTQRSLRRGGHTIIMEWEAPPMVVGSRRRWGCDYRAHWGSTVTPP